MDSTYWGLVFLWILFLLYIPFSILYLRNSEIHPIKGRAPRVVLALNVCLLTFGANTLANVLFLDLYPCTLTVWITFLFGTLGSQGIYIYRLLRLLFSYEITKNILEQTKKAKVDWKQNWFTRNRRLVGPYFINRFATLTVMFFILVLIIITGASPELSGTSACPNRVTTSALSVPLKAWFVIYGIITGALLLFMTILGVKLRQYHRDAFAIKNEFTIVMWTAYPAFYVWLCLSLTPEPSWVTTGYMVSFALHSIFLVGTVWPWILSLREKKLVKEAEKNEKAIGLQLVEILEIEEGFKAFEAYLQTEFSSENLEFWGEVKEFQIMQVNDHQAVKAHITYIYERYIIEGAPNQVNISFTQSKEVETQVNKLNEVQVDETTLRIFDMAQHDVYALMSTDTFQRFLRTDEAKVVIKKIMGLRRSKAADPSGQKFLAQNLADGAIEIEEVKHSPSTTEISITVATVSTPAIQRTLTRAPSSAGEKESITLSPAGMVRGGRTISQSPSFYRGLNKEEQQSSPAASPSLLSASSPPSPSLGYGNPSRNDDMPGLVLAIPEPSQSKPSRGSHPTPSENSTSTPHHLDHEPSSSSSSSRRMTDETPLVGIDGSTKREN